MEHCLERLQAMAAHALSTGMAADYAALQPLITANYEVSILEGMWNLPCEVKL